MDQPKLLKRLPQSLVSRIKDKVVLCNFFLKGTHYDHGNIGSTIYIASGNTVDWVFGTANITFSYAVELRDTGKCHIYFLELVSIELYILR